MRASKFLAVTISVCAFALMADVPAYAQAQAQGQQQVPPQARKTPLGRHLSEVLASKVTVTDMQKSHEFYTKVIGLKPAKTLSMTEPQAPPGADKSKWPVEYGYNFTGSYGDAFFDILRPRPDNMPTKAAASLVTIIFKVPDAPAVIRRAKEMGYEVIREAPVVGPDEMSIGFISDPDGYRIEILQAANYPPGVP